MALVEDVHDFVRPHVESFDWLLSHGLDLIVDNIHPVIIPSNPDTDRPDSRLWVKQIR